MKLRELREQLATYRNMPDADLSRELNESYRELFNLRMRHSSRQLDNDRELVRVKKSIARIKTVLRERDIARVFEAFEEDSDE